MLQPLTSLLPGYIQNSESVLSQLAKPGSHPSTALICTCDATSMYSNISTTEGILAIEKYLETFSDDIDKVYGMEGSFNKNFILKLLCLVTEFNVFQFEDTWWHQLTGTAMGTPCACVYATLFFGYFEWTVLLPWYKKQYHYYERQIDNILLIWNNKSSTTPCSFLSFFKDLNNVSSLDWTTDGLSRNVNFLYLTISLDSNGSISTKTFHVIVSYLRNIE